MENDIYKTIKQGTSIRKLALKYNIGKKKAENYIKNYKKGTFDEYFNSTTGEVKVLNLNYARQVIGYLKFNRCDDKNKLREVLYQLDIKISDSTIRRYLKEGGWIKFSIFTDEGESEQSFSYLKDMYKNTLGFNLFGYITNSTFYGTMADTFENFYKFIIPIVKCLDKGDYEDIKEVYNKYLKYLGLQSREKFYKYYIWKLALIIHRTNSLDILDKVEFIYFRVEGYSILDKKQKDILDTQILNKEILLITEDEWKKFEDSDKLKHKNKLKQKKEIRINREEM